MDGDVDHPYFATTIFIGILLSFNGTLLKHILHLSTYPDVTQPVLDKEY